MSLHFIRYMSFFHSNCDVRIRLTSYDLPNKHYILPIKHCCLSFRLSYGLVMACASRDGSTTYKDLSDDEERCVKRRTTECRVDVTAIPSFN